MKKILLFVLCALLLCGSATIATANLIQNPGFESNDGTSDFAVWSESGPGLVSVSTYEHTGTYSAFLSLGSYTGTGTAAQVRQSFNYAEAGTYEFGAYFSFVSIGAPPTSWPKDRSGVTSSVHPSNGDDAFHPNKIWSIDDSLSWTSLPGTNAWRSEWYLISNTFDLAGPYAGDPGVFYLYLQRYAGISAVYVDDAYVARVPEPATMLLLGTGLIGLATLRRKFKK